MPTQNTNNYGATLKEAERHIANREPFHTGTLSGAWEQYDKDGTQGYVVRSYGVLIAEAYKNFAGLATDAYQYSVTTSKHANIVKRAWGIA
jgi:hypothetical protein